MSNMAGFMAKKRSGGSIGQGAVKGCGKKKTISETSPQPKKILDGKVVDKQGLPPKAKL